MVTLEIVGSSPNTISVKVTGMSERFERTRYFTWFLNSIPLSPQTSIPPYSSEAPYTFSGLDPNTWYHLDVNIYDSDKTTLITSLYKDASTEPAPVDPWYWNTAELNAFNNHGNFSVLTASRWNQFCDRINETCIAANDSWITTYTTFSDAKAFSSGVPLTALMFNSIRLNIGARVSTGIAEVSTGDTIYGWYFITLQEKLNQWIASL